MSILSDAFQHTLDARERVVGIREKIIINGVTVDSLVETVIPFPSDPIPGGIINSSTFICQVATVDIPTPPAIGMDVIVRGRLFQLLDIQDVNQIAYHFVVGDAASE